MKAWKNYFLTMQDVVQKVLDTQEENIMQAAKILANTTKNGGIIYGFGTGHSHLVTDDAFWRAATPANYCALLEQSATGSFEITKSYHIENTYGIGKLMVDYHRITPKDCMIIISNSGNNAVTLEFAKICKERGFPVIVLTNTEYSATLKPRHSSGKHLMDFGDVVISNCSALGDAAVAIEGLPMKVGSTSSIPFLFLINAILAEAVDLCMKEGFIPDVYYNGSLRVNNPALGEHNFAIIDKYFYRMRNL